MNRLSRTGIARRFDAGHTQGAAMPLLFTRSSHRSNDMIDALMQVAVAKAIPAKQLTMARDAVKVGEYDVDITVRILGSIEVKPGHEQTYPGAVPWETLFMAAFDKLNGAARASLLRELHDAQTDGSLDVLREDVEARVKDEVYDAVACLKEATVKMTGPKILPRLVVEAVA